MCYDILCVVSTIPFGKKCHSEHEIFVLLWVWQWDYFGSTLCIIQFARAIFSVNSLCMLHFSILVNNIFGHILTWFFLIFCFCCMPSSNFFEWLAEGQVSGILNIVVKWKHTPRCSHRICSCAQIVGEHLVHHMQTRKIFTWLPRLLKLDLSVKYYTSNSHSM